MLPVYPGPTIIWLYEPALDWSRPYNTSLLPAVKKTLSLAFGTAPPLQFAVVFQSFGPAFAVGLALLTLAEPVVPLMLMLNGRPATLAVIVTTTPSTV